ncbi:MAG: hypothetical protein ACRC42_02430 [Mycoplasma sp.]
MNIEKLNIRKEIIEKMLGENNDIYFTSVLQRELSKVNRKLAGDGVNGIGTFIWSVDSNLSPRYSI